MRYILVFIVKMYQAVISPFYPPVCRFEPSCSNYAIQAVQKYGVIRGSSKAIWRILHCHPFSKKFGHDPV